MCEESTLQCTQLDESLRSIPLTYLTTSRKTRLVPEIIVAPF